MMATDPLARALDHFDVPNMAPDLASRIVLAATAGSGLPPRAPLRHDRSRWWRRGRQVLVGGVAAGMLSAAAVASGLLGAAGIQVPVLTAMLAPKPVPKPVVKPPHHVAPVRHATPKPVTPAPETEIAQTGAESLIVDRERRLAVRAARREIFVANHPYAAAAIERRIAARIAARRAAAGRPLGPMALTPDGRPANPELRARVERQMDLVLWRRAMMRRAALAQSAQGGAVSQAIPQGQGMMTRADRIRRWQQWRQRRAQAGAAADVDQTGNQSVAAGEPR